MRILAVSLLGALLCFSVVFGFADPPRQELHGDDPQSVFIRAARDGNLPLMAALLAHEEIDIDRGGYENKRSYFTQWPPLWEAARMGRTEAVFWLLKNGASVDFRNPPRNAPQPMTSAILHNDLRMLQALLEAGERPLSSDRINWAFRPRIIDYPKVAAVTYDRLECLQLMREYGIPVTGSVEFPRSKPYSLFLYAVNAGAVRTVSYLLELGEDPNQMHRQIPAVTIAAGSYSVETLKLLLAAGADANAVTTMRGDPVYAVYTPLIRAAENGDLEMVNVLLKAGADVSRGDHIALYHASLRADQDVYDRLVSAGARWVPDRFPASMRETIFSSVETNKIEGLGHLAKDFKSQVLGRDAAETGPSNAVRLAVLPGAGAATAAALLQAQLSAGSVFELLEREALDRILDELQLNRAQLATSDYSQVLALTPAEYVVVLTARDSSSTGQTEFVWAELVAIHTGEVVGAWLIKASGPEVEENINYLAAQVGGLVARISAGDGLAKVVLESVRHNDVGMKARKLENEFNMILRSWLACDPSVRLLEREGLAHVVREQAFDGRALEVDAGSALISGGVDPLPEGGYRLRLRITSPGGTEVDFEVIEKEMSALVAAVYPQLVEQLGMGSTSTFDREQEAMQLLKQAQWAGNAQLHRQAVRLTDAAWALHPNPGVIAEDRLKVRDQLLAQPLNALSGQRNRMKPLPILPVGAPDSGHPKALDPLFFYDMDLDEEALLDLLETSFGLLEQIARTDPERIVSQRDMYLPIFLRLGRATSLFAPIHRQKANANRLNAVRQQGREAVRALYDVEWEPGLKANPFVASRRVWRQLPYLFDPEALPPLYLRHLAAMEENAYFLLNMRGGGTGRYAGIRDARSSNTTYPSRPLFPRVFWKSVPDLLSDESGWLARVKAPTLTAALGPLAAHYDLKFEIQRLAMENQTVPAFYHIWAFSLRDLKLPRVTVKELRELVHTQEKFELYDITNVPGYVEIDRQLASALDKKSRGDPDMHRSHVFFPRQEVLDRFLYEHPDIRSVRKEIDESPMLKPIKIFHPEQVTPNLKETYRSILFTLDSFVTTKNFVFIILDGYPHAGLRDAPGILVYRISRQDQTFGHFPIPPFLHKRPRNVFSASFSKSLGVAETETHIMASSPHTGGIGLYDKRSGTWQRVEGYSAGGRRGDVAAINNRFVFLAERGDYRPAHIYRQRQEQSLIVSLDPISGDVVHLADNLRTPPRYPFEDPGLWFGELRVSQESDYIETSAVYFEPANPARKEVRVRGGFHIDTGEWERRRRPNAISSHQPNQKIGDNIFHIRTRENLSGEGREFVFSEGDIRGPSTRVIKDERPVEMLQASLFPDDATVGRIRYDHRARISLDDLLIIGSGAYVRLYEHAHVLSAIEQGRQLEAARQKELSPQTTAMHPVSDALAGSQTGALKTLRLPSGGELSFRWIEDARVWAAIQEVSNEQFRLFRPEHDSGSFRGRSLNSEEQPAVRVTHREAVAYCDWLTKTLGLESQGLRVRLPTGEEWSAFARVGEERKYPWGDALSDVTGNYYDRSGVLALGPTPIKFRKGHRLPLDHDSGFAVSAPVTSVPENEFGLHGVGGNVWEWTMERGKEGEPVVRGGSWRTYHEPKMRIDHRFEAPSESRMNTIGFRVVLGGVEPNLNN